MDKEEEDKILREHEMAWMDAGKPANSKEFNRWVELSNQAGVIRRKRNEEKIDEKRQYFFDVCNGNRYQAEKLFLLWEIKNKLK